jgi:cell division protein FtsI (penicillin-binding protein 3)
MKSVLPQQAATDIFEPGSSIKPFIVAAALSSGRFRTDSMIDTTPIKVGIKTIQDKHDLGVIDLGQVLARSSNVGMAKIALALEPEDLHSTLRALGFGEVTASGFPGESAGLLSSAAHWRPIGIATMSYGYGLHCRCNSRRHTTVRALLQRPITFAARRRPHISTCCPRRSHATCWACSSTPCRAARAQGCGAGTVSRQDGTAWKATAGGYSTDRYLAVFAGVVPATRPRLAAVVLIDEPGGALYYGGDVAAPVFSAVMSGALRLMSVAPDDLARVAPATLAEAGP